MTLRNLIITTLCCTTASCGHMSGGDHLSRQQMESIIYDVTIAEAYSTKTPDNISFGGLKNMDTLAGYYKDVLDHYHISKEQFQTSLAWYKSQPNEIDSIYTHLSARADKMNAEEMKHRPVQTQAVNQQPSNIGVLPATPTSDTQRIHPRRRLPQSIQRPK